MAEVSSEQGLRDSAMELIADNIACVRGGLGIFEGVSFTVGAGEAIVVMGPNGAGKTSLLRILAGFLTPQSGNVRLSPSDGKTRPEMTAYLGHANGLKGALTVRENALFWCGLLDSDTARADDLLARFNLAGLTEMPVAYLSAGQQRRLALSRLLFASRPLWLLDEPAASLDDAGRVALEGEMTGHLSRGGMIVAASHGALGVPVTQTIELGALAAHGQGREYL